MTERSEERDARGEDEGLRDTGDLSFAWGWWIETIRRELRLAAEHGMGRRSDFAFGAVAMFLAEFARTQPVFVRLTDLLQSETGNTDAFRPPASVLAEMAADLTALLDELSTEATP